MIIRREVFQAFAAVPRAEFRRSLIGFLREQFPDAKDMPAAELEAGVDLCIAKAESYGIDTCQDVATYTVTAFLVGVDFDTDFPAATDILVSPVLGSGDKAQWLREWTAELFRALEDGN